MATTSRWMQLFIYCLRLSAELCNVHSMFRRTKQNLINFIPTCNTVFIKYLLKNEFCKVSLIKYNFNILSFFKMKYITYFLYPLKGSCIFILCYHGISCGNPHRSMLPKQFLCRKQFHRNSTRKLFSQLYSTVKNIPVKLQVEAGSKNSSNTRKKIVHYFLQPVK